MDRMSDLNDQERHYQQFLEGIVRDIKAQFGAVTNSYEVGKMIPEFLASHEAGHYQDSNPETLTFSVDFKERFMKFYEAVVLHGNG